jgi:hypothetical protein
MATYPPPPCESCYGTSAEKINSVADMYSAYEFLAGSIRPVTSLYREAKLITTYPLSVTIVDVAKTNVCI